MQKENQANEPNSLRQMAIIAAIVATGYYLTALVSLTQRFPSVVSQLWLPNAFLLGVLLMTQRRHWWLYLSAALPSHVLAHAPVGVPFSVMVVQFSGNIGQAVLSAVAVQYFTIDLKRFDRLRDVILFIVIAGIIVPALVSLLVASAFVAIEWVHNFPQVWRTRFLSNFLATLTITPLTILVWDKAGSALPAVSVRRCTEASALILGIVAAGLLISVSSSAEPYQFMALLYLPLPFFLWAAVRFGLGGVCLSVLLFGEVLVLGTLQPHGPFAAQSSQESALAINLFLSVTAVPLLMLGVLLKERNQSEQSIRASESIKNAIIKSSLDAVITINHQGKIIEFNPEAERMFGYSRTEALGNSVAELIIPPSLRERHSRGLAHNLATGESRILGKVVEMQAMRADGSKFPAELSVVRIDLDELTIFTGQIRDLTERKRAELQAYQDRAKIAHANRVATMAELAASLAHQISQPLATIAALNRAAQRWLSRTPPNLDETRTALEDIDAGCDRASEVIRSVRAMYRKADREKIRLSVNDVIEDTLNFLHGDIQSYQVSVRTELLRDLPQVIADRTQLQQVFLNLITNALQAMGPVTNGERLLVVKSGLRDPGTVGITVEDSGTGIDPSDMEFIFDAQFTTKSDGMGIGLSICRSIIDAHGGRVWASPGASHGSVFHVVLPSSEQ